jgi:hypothetical protein
VPQVRWRDFQTRLPTEDEIRAWFLRGVPMNIAVITGAVSDIVVIDADSRPAMEWAVLRLPYTPWQTRTARGYHLWYRHPGVRVPNRARIEVGDQQLELDVRGDGGYVIAPESIHASGNMYREAGDWSVPHAELPRFWPGWVARPSRQRREVTRKTVATGRSHAPGDVLARARRYLAAIPIPIIDHASDNQTLSAACRLVRGFDLTAADAEELLWEWAGDRPGWTREWIAEKVAHAERYGTEPIGALR